MADFFAELKHRQIYRVGAAYVVAAWVLTQVIEILAQVFTLPLWIAQTAIVLLAIGFPIALLVAWTIERRPHEAVVSAVRSKPTIVDWTLCGALILVIVLVSYQQLASSREFGPPQDGVAKARDASLGAGIAVAVLPFANLSADPEQEFFSDGMTEEITAVLAKVPDLRVVARTSAFQFKDQNRDIQAIAQALKATHLIEGSVRRAGTRLRITAQLINADNGNSIWAETYDREFSDVFQVQEDIARAIAGALRMPLSLPQLVSSRTSDVGIYEQYLRARISFNSRAGGFQEVLDIVTRDPNFAPGWSLLAQGNIAALAGATRGSFGENLRRYVGLPPGTGPTSELEARSAVNFLLDRAEIGANKAIELDPSLPSGYATLGNIQGRRKNWLEAERLVLQALERDPDNPEGLHVYSGLLSNAGRLKEALPIRIQLQTLEPFAQLYNIVNAQIMGSAGQSAAGIAILEAMSPSNTLTYNRNWVLAAAYAAQGRYPKAADTLLLIRAQLPREAEEAARLLRSAPAKVSAPTALPTFNSELNFVYAHIGAMDRVMEYYERGLSIGNVQGAGRLWDPVYAPLRKTDPFKKFVRDYGLTDYWRARGWPDLCQPVGADDFVCE